MNEIKTFEGLVQAELSKYDSVIPAVEELKAQFMGLAIQDINDKENYDKVKEAIKFMIAKRTAVEEKRKELKADSLAFGRAVDARAKEIVSLISPIEDHLKNEKAKIDEEIEHIKRQEEEHRQMLLRARQQKLLDAGMIPMGNEFVWTNPNTQTIEQSFAFVNLETFEDADFNDFVLFISNLDKTESEKFLFEEKKRRDELDKLEQQRLDLLKAQQELLAEQEKMRQEQEKMRKDMEQLKASRTNARLQQLLELGLTSVPHRAVPEENGGSMWEKLVCLNYLDNHVPIIPEDRVRYMDQEEWDMMFHSITKKVSDLKKDADIRHEEKLERLRLEAEEKAALKLAEQKEHEEKLEAERVAMLSDKEKVSDYCRKLLDVPTPQIKTIKWNKELKKITEVIVNYL